MTVLDFYKVISDEAMVNIYGKDDDINYYYGKASDIPVKYLDLIIGHITSSYNSIKYIMVYMLWV